TRTPRATREAAGAGSWVQRRHRAPGSGGRSWRWWSDRCAGVDVEPRQYPDRMPNDLDTTAYMIALRRLEGSIAMLKALSTHGSWFREGAGAIARSELLGAMRDLATSYGPLRERVSPAVPEDMDARIAEATGLVDGAVGDEIPAGLAGLAFGLSDYLGVARS